MEEFGIDKSRLFVDKQSGKDFNRPAYLKLLAQVSEDDCIVIKSIDRLGRNYDEINDLPRKWLSYGTPEEEFGGFLEDIYAR